MNQLLSPLPFAWRARRPIVLASMYLKFGPIFNFPGTTAQHIFEVTHHRVKKIVVASTEYRLHESYMLLIGHVPMISSLSRLQPRYSHRTIDIDASEDWANRRGSRK